MAIGVVIHWRGMLPGWPLGALLAVEEVRVWIGDREGNNLVVGTLLIPASVSFLIHRFFAAKSRQVEAERRATEAQLRLRQAWIEPHICSTRWPMCKA